MVSDERLKELRNEVCANAGYQHVHDASALVSIIDELLQARATLANRAAVREPAKCEWHNRPDLVFARYKGGPISEQCPKCARHSPECASPGSCHYDGQRSVEPKTETYKTAPVHVDESGNIFRSTRDVMLAPLSLSPPVSKSVAKRIAAQKGEPHVTVKSIIAAAYVPDEPGCKDPSTLLFRIGFLAGMIFRMKPYLEHRRGCALYEEPIQPCDCGLSELQTDLEKE